MNDIIQNPDKYKRMIEKFASKNKDIGYHEQSEIKAWTNGELMLIGETVGYIFQDVRPKPNPFGYNFFIKFLSLRPEDVWHEATICDVPKIENTDKCSPEPAYYFDETGVCGVTLGSQGFGKVVNEALFGMRTKYLKLMYDLGFRHFGWIQHDRPAIFYNPSDADFGLYAVVAPVRIKPSIVRIDEEKHAV